MYLYCTVTKHSKIDVQLCGGKILQYRFENTHEMMIIMFSNWNYNSEDGNHVFTLNVFCEIRLTPIYYNNSRVSFSDP